MKNKPKRFPWFWLFYVLYIAAFAAAIYYGLSLLWNFLDVYESTRPVHCMERTMTIFEKENADDLEHHLTNTVDNPYEDTSVLLSLFYDSIEGKELSFGKLSGSYTESHPVYAVLADKVHVATVSLVSDNTVVDYNLSGWNLKDITLLLTPTKSFAITVPSSMSVQINGLPILEEHLLSTVETDTPVSYVNYAFSGLYREPDIRVTDRYGSEVALEKDEETGGLYHKLAYALAPASMTVSFGGHILNEENTLVSGIKVEELSIISETAGRFSEYQNLPEQLTIPTFTEYYVDFAYTKDNVIFTDRFGTICTPDFDSERNKYSHDLVSDASLREECIAYASDFLEKIALFSTGDVGKTDLQPFFPKNSAYFKLIASHDNRYFGRHSSITFENHELKEFFAYSENLVYIQMAIDEKMYLNSTGKYTTVKLTHPLWLVKQDGNWYVARIIYEELVQE